MPLETATPETPLADFFAMPVEFLMLNSIGGAVVGSLRLEGGRTVQILGAHDESWRSVLDELITAAVAERRTHA